jgi:broad specificity phosphatase PhoE
MAERVGCTGGAGMTMLTLIRHAHPQAAITGVVAGPKGDTGLSDLGRRQAAALRDRLMALGFTTDVVLTSILPRAVETARILAPALGEPEIEQDCDLCELHPGDADGIPWDEYRARYNVVPYETPDKPFSPGGESLRELEQRATRVLADVTARHPDERVTIVSHGGFISAACLQLLGARLTVPRGFLLSPAHTSMTTWTTSTEREGLWRLERYNDAAHLEGLGVVS